MKFNQGCSVDELIKYLEIIKTSYPDENVKIFFANGMILESNLEIEYKTNITGKGDGILLTTHSNSKIIYKPNNF